MPRKVHKNRKEHRISQDSGMEEKHCSKCDTWKPLEAYCKNNEKWDKLMSACKSCHNERQRRRRGTKEERARYNAQCRRSQQKRRRNGKRNAYLRERRKNDPTFRLKCYLSSCISNGLKAQGIRKKPGTTIEFLGCSYAELMDHLESLFQPGMTRENYGSVWHDDHIVPRAAFGASREELMIVNWYKNMQPMFAKENIAKGSKYKEEDKIALIERYNTEHAANYMQEYLEKS